MVYTELYPTLTKSFAIHRLYLDSVAPTFYLLRKLLTIDVFLSPILSLPAEKEVPPYI
jgi:hypothetical protein